MWNWKVYSIWFHVWNLDKVFLLFLCCQIFINVYIIILVCKGFFHFSHVLNYVDVNNFYVMLWFNFHKIMDFQVYSKAKTFGGLKSQTKHAIGLS